MRVYGDRVTTVSPESGLEVLSTAAVRISDMPPGIARHAALVGVFIEVAKLIQGVADHDMRLQGGDGFSAAEDALMPVLMQLAAAVMLSWDSGFSQLDMPCIGIATSLPTSVEVRSPEGYAYYGLYPEAYAVAARGLPAVDGPTRVIGIRSIGTGLAALVATEVGAPPPLTVRPTGHPFAREIRLIDRAFDRILAPGARYVVVDEGPGLSGSSFAAVAAALISAGVAVGQIIFMPSHGNAPGPEASPATRALWADVTVVPADSGGLVTDHRLREWASTLLGSLDEVHQDLSGGAWRSTRLFADPPPWDPRTDRRKLLVRNGEGRWLVKFAGLGTLGERKAERGRRLWRAGLAPEVRGVVHGFLVHRWIEGTQREAAPTVDEVAHYLAERAQWLAPPRSSGASLSELADMAVFNASVELGFQAAEGLKRSLGDPARLQQRSRPLAIDGKLDRWEWLRSADGRLMKVDALDHDADHDLIGPQDLAWDVAGASVELTLSASLLAEKTGRLAGTSVDPALLAFLTPCYIAFRLGAARTAQSLQGEAEGRLNGQAAARYSHLLSVWLSEEENLKR